MSGVSLVNGEDLQHVAVVFFQEAFHALRVPIRRRRTDRVEAGRLRIEWRRGLQISQRIPALELRHFDDLTAIGIGQAKDVMLPDECFDAIHRGAGVLHQVFRFAVLLTDGVDHLADGHTPTSYIVRRQHHRWVILAPKLAGDDIHVALHAGKLRLGVRQYFPGSNSSVEHQLEFAGELFPAQTPIPRRARHQGLFEELLIALQQLGHRRGGRFHRAALRRFTDAFQDAFFVKGNRAAVLANRRLQDRTRRPPQAVLCRGDDFRYLRHARYAIGHIRLFRQRGLGQDQIDAVIDVTIVSAWILFKRTGVLRQPDHANELLFEDLEIYLTGA